MTTKRKPGRPKSPKGPRPHIVKVSLHADELQTLLDVTKMPPIDWTAPRKDEDAPF